LMMKMMKRMRYLDWRWLFIDVSGWLYCESCDALSLFAAFSLCQDLVLLPRNMVVYDLYLLLH
jgi:hypothetical protein